LDGYFLEVKLKERSFDYSGDYNFDRRFNREFVVIRINLLNFIKLDWAKEKVAGIVHTTHATDLA